MATVLVAEDDQLLRWSLEQSLSRDGHVVHSVGSRAAVLDATRGGGYRVAIVDRGAAEPSWAHLLHGIKKQSPQTHVIVITAQASHKLERQARDIGAFEFLEKPFHLSAIKQAVARAIVTPERRKGPRGCCGGCEWQKPCLEWQMAQSI
jgi:DNA-binding NtrC family response regulator